jgi:cytochrome c peroxidase
VQPWQAAALCLLTLVGCKPAGRYDASPPKSKAVEPSPSLPMALDPGINWTDARWGAPEDVPIEFVTESDGDEWAQLPSYWNPSASAAAGLVGLGPSFGQIGAVPSKVLIKVPAGLDDPGPSVPAADSLLLGQWELGRRLFFDKKWLTAAGDVSCATCHDPSRGFTDGLKGHSDGRGLINAPTLVNCSYNRRQFWDGRVASLEEVVQRTLADEQERPRAAEGLFHHVWDGVVRRLRVDDRYRIRFKEVLGAEPTQDSVGRALATYLRTLLAADSPYDRALREQAAVHAPALGAVHYEKLLDPATLKGLGREKANKGAVAEELIHGYRLFYGQEEGRKTNCISCHGGREFTDGRFHNLGVGWGSPEIGHETGYFPYAPLGQKSRTLIGAFKTPTLRGLQRTGPYFHDGSAATLEDAVSFHSGGGRLNDYLDPLIPRSLHGRDDLTPVEIDALVLFLKALNGEPVDASVASPPSD